MIWKAAHKRIWFSTSASALVSAFLSSLFVALSAKKSLAGATESIEAIKEMIVPMVTQSTEWGMKVGLGITGAIAFYALVIRTIRLGD